MESFIIVTVTVPSYAPILPQQYEPVKGSEQLSLPLLDVATTAIVSPSNSITPKVVMTDHLANPIVTVEQTQVIEPTGYSAYIFRKIDAASNCRRSYMISYQPSFFVEHCLVRQWGRIGSQKQHIKHQEFNSREETLVGLKRAIKRRLKRGYIQVEN